MMQIYANYNSSPPLYSTTDNLLINADFRTPINQRSFASGALADGIYGIDRWKASGASNITIGSSLTINSGSLVQVIEDPQLNGVEITISALGGTATGTIDGQAFSVTASVSTTMTIASTGNISVVLSTAVALTGLKIEYGSFGTPFQPRPFAVEEFLCLRYFERLTSDTVYDSPAFFILSNSLFCNFFFRFSKRVQPTSTISGLKVISNGTSAQTGFTFSESRIAPNFIRIDADKTAHGMTSGSVIRIDTGDYIDIDAEL